ncbi:hypothetical protein NST38_30845 [Paenibacillus sp. FSL H8-0104]|uniref:hypothetical protein n=1 Tax=Paenibacillus sp. FSL H8-0104 TaxID=2954509 RepID=UPI0030FD3816
MLNPISVDLRQLHANRFEVKEGRYFLDGCEVSADEAITSLAISVQALGDQVECQKGVPEKKGYADSQLIDWLLNQSGVSCYQISKKSKIGESTLSRISNGETSMHSIRFGTAIKLTEYARRIQDERMGSGKVNLEKGIDIQ